MKSFCQQVDESISRVHSYPPLFPLILSPWQVPASLFICVKVLMAGWQGLASHGSGLHLGADCQRSWMSSSTKAPLTLILTWSTS